MNFDFRPATYQDAEINALLATIKGDSRKREVIDLINRGEVEKLRDWLVTSNLSDDDREARASIHPWLMGGEYLPDHARSELEIARISLESTTADVISVRARWDDATFHYRIVDEYETPYTARPAQTALPLTLGELIDMIDFTSGDGTESFIDTLRRNADRDGNEPEEALAFVTVTSDFYPALREYYDLAAREWIVRRSTEPSFKYGLHKLADSISLSRAMNIFEFACNKPDTLFITESWFVPRAVKMRALLSDPLTEERAEALRDVVLQRHRLDDLIEWLEHMPRMSWRDYVEHKAHVSKELATAEQEQRLAKHMEWLEKVKSMPRPACPSCDLTDQVVPIVYGLPSRPIFPTQGLFVRGGCVVDEKQWHCKRCANSDGSLQTRKPSESV